MLRATEVSFKLGRLVATPAAIEAITAAGDDIARLITRHLSLEQGALSIDDHKMNVEAAINDDGRIFSAFLLNDGVKLWIITEDDRSVTTLLLPSDY